MVDNLISTEILTLAPKQLLHKEIIYPIPAYFLGEYEVWVVSKSTGGLDLGLGNAGKINLAKKQDSLAVDSERCTLKVADLSTVYNLAQGVDISKDEKLTLVCQVENPTNNQLIATPTFSTFRRTQYGPLTKIDYPTETAITFAPKEKKEVAISIPKATEPQAYDVVISFVNQVKLPIAEKIIAHYVLQGQSATIQNISLDKENYVKGENITASLFWTPSADGFPGSRLGKGTEIPKVLVDLNINDGQGKPCINSFSQELKVEQEISTLVIPAISNCANPKATASIADGNGKVLDSRTIGSAAEVPASNQEKLKEQNSKTIILVFVLILLLISLGLILWKVKGKKTGPKSFLLLALTLGGLLLGNQTKASSYTYYGYGTLLLNTAKPSTYVYNYKENVPIAGTLESSACANYGIGWLFSGSTKYNELFDTTCPSGFNVKGCTNTGVFFGNYFRNEDIDIHQEGFTRNFNFALRMPTQEKATQLNQSYPPYRKVIFSGYTGITSYGSDMHDGISFSMDLLLPEFPVPVNGICGSASGVARSAAPSSGLCVTGIASAVITKATSFDWSCDGSGGGVPASCSAPKLDNGCATNVCIGLTCDNGINPTTPGTKVCNPDCANTTCTTATCDNGSAIVPGNLICDPNCGANTCIGSTCNNGTNPLTPGTKDCSATPCNQSMICQTSNIPGEETFCSDGVTPGAKTSNFQNFPSFSDPVCDATNCGTTLKQICSCFKQDLNGCFINEACSASDTTAICSTVVIPDAPACPACSGGGGSGGSGTGSGGSGGGTWTEVTPE